MDILLQHGGFRPRRREASWLLSNTTGYGGMPTSTTSITITTRYRFLSRAHKYKVIFGSRFKRTMFYQPDGRLPKIIRSIQRLQY